MPIFEKIRDATRRLVGRPTSVIKSNPPPSSDFWYHNALRLDPFTNGTITAMLKDDHVSFSFGLKMAPLHAVEFEIEGDDSTTMQFALAQHKAIWKKSIGMFEDSAARGFAGFETLSRLSTGGPFAGLAEFSRLKPFVTESLLPLTIDDEIVAMTIEGAISRDEDTMYNGRAALWGIKKLWLSHGEDYGSPFGQSILEPAYPAWVNKRGEQGTCDLHRLWMKKYAFMGNIVFYPDTGKFTYPDGTEIAASDHADMVARAIAAGATVACPHVVDQFGNREWELVSATSPDGGSGLIEAMKHDDEQIAEGIGVPSEVYRAEKTGSGYSGRSIPFIAFLLSCQDIAQKWADQIDDQYVRELCKYNFGRTPNYSISVKSLVKTIGDLMGDGGMMSSLRNTSEPEKPQQQQPSKKAPPRLTGAGQTAQMSATPSPFEDRNPITPEAIEAAAEVAEAFRDQIIASGVKKKRLISQKF